MTQGNSKIVDILKKSDKALLKCPDKLLASRAFWRIVFKTNINCLYYLPEKAEWIYSDIELMKEALLSGMHFIRSINFSDEVFKELESLIDKIIIEKISENAERLGYYKKLEEERLMKLEEEEKEERERKKEIFLEDRENAKKNAILKHKELKKDPNYKPKRKTYRRIVYASKNIFKKKK